MYIPALHYITGKTTCRPGIALTVTHLATTSLSTFTMQYGSLVPVLEVTDKKKKKKVRGVRGGYIKQIYIFF